MNNPLQDIADSWDGKSCTKITSIQRELRDIYTGGFSNASVNANLIEAQNCLREAVVALREARRDAIAGNNDACAKQIDKALDAIVGDEKVQF